MSLHKVLLVFLIGLSISCSTEQSEYDYSIMGLTLNNKLIYELNSVFYDSKPLGSNNLIGYTAYFFKDFYDSFPIGIDHTSVNPERIVIGAKLYDKKDSDLDLSKDFISLTVSSLRAYYSNTKPGKDDIESDKIINNVKIHALKILDNSSKIEVAIDVLFADGDIAKIRYAGPIKHSGICYY